MASPKPKVLLLGEIDHAHEAWASLSTIADLITPTATSRAAFIQECQTPHLADAQLAYRTFASVSITGLWDAELIAALPASLRFVAHNGAGYDQLDLAACSARQPHPLRVSNVPTAVDDATADTAVFLLLGALRGFNSSMLALRAGDWKGNPAPPLGHDPQGKTLGVLGMGGIGRNLKRKCDVFGMRTIYHNRRRLSEEEADGAEYVSFEELLARSDVLSLNLPLNVSLFPRGPFAFLASRCFGIPFFSLMLRPLSAVVYLHPTSPLHPPLPIDPLPPSLPSSQLTPPLPAQNPPHHLDRRVREDETRRRHHQHGARRRHGRGRAGRRAGQRPSALRRARRLRGRAPGASGPCCEFGRYARAS